MKKIALILAVLMLVGMLSACNKQESVVTVPGYLIHIPTDGTWTVAEETDYDLEMKSGKLNAVAVAYVPTDFVDPPTAEDLYWDHNEDLAEQYEGLTVEQAKKSYTSGEKTIWTTLYRAGNQSVYSCMISLGNEAESMIWIAFSGPAEDLQKYLSECKAMLEGMTCDAEPSAWEEQEEDLLEDELIDGIEDETEYVDDPGTPPEDQVTPTDAPQSGA